MKVIKSAEVHAFDNTVNDSPRNDVSAKGDVADPTNVLDEPPPDFVNADGVSLHIAQDDLNEVIIFNDDKTNVGVIIVPSSFNIFQKPSSSNAFFFHFGIFSSSKASNENEDLKRNEITPLYPETTLQGHQEIPTQEYQHDEN